jgi:serine/threonine protein kinase
MRLLSVRHSRGPASDLFQLGVLMHLLLAQQHPFDRLTELETLDAIVGRHGELPPSLPRHVPPALRDYIGRLMATDPHFRPDSAEEVLMELAMRANLPMTGFAEPPPPAETPWLDHAFGLARLLSLWGPVSDRGD